MDDDCWADSLFETCYSAHFEVTEVETPSGNRIITTNGFELDETCWLDLDGNFICDSVNEMVDVGEGHCK